MNVLTLSEQQYNIKNCLYSYIKLIEKALIVFSCMYVLIMDDLRISGYSNELIKMTNNANFWMNDNNNGNCVQSISKYKYSSQLIYNKYKSGLDQVYKSEQTDRLKDTLS